MSEKIVIGHGTSLPHVVEPWPRLDSMTVITSRDSWACNCIGPQPGEKLCPCRLRAESEKGRKMVTDGVIINGVHYKLVPDPRP